MKNIILILILFLVLEKSYGTQSADFKDLKSAAEGLIATEVANNYVKMYSLLNDGVRDSISLERFVQLVSSAPRLIHGKYRSESTIIVRGNPALGYVIMKSLSGTSPLLIVMVLENEKWKVLSFPQGRAGRLLDTFIQIKLKQ